MEFIATDRAPRAIGPYCQATVVGNVIYTAGQIALDPGTMEMVGKDVAEQTDRVLRNLAAVLEAAGSSLQHVLKTSVFLTDMADFPAMNEVYARHFGDHRPARSTVAVQTLPKSARVEIDAIALKHR
jgi:2-iminobutanoate/2-iminopropanoate deaminase